MHLFIRVLIMIVAATLATGCKGEEQACKTDCPGGQYCGSGGKCTFDCRFDNDCPSGKKCSQDGKCLAPGAIDGGAFHDDDGVPDEQGTGKIKDGPNPFGDGGKGDGIHDKVDKGGAKGDGIHDKVDKGGAKQDTGGKWKDASYFPEGGVSGTLNCAQISSCADKCTSTLCIQKCTCLGTVVAQDKYKALLTCIQNASAGPCAAVCTVPGSTACGACAQKTCTAEYKKCLFGPPQTGFGDICNATKLCSTGFHCTLATAGASAGFCSKTCGKTGDFCTGPPTNTEAYCLFSDGKNKLCAFLCKYTEYGKTATASCPTGMVCSAKENPAGSGQHFCIP